MPLFFYSFFLSEPLKEKERKKEAISADLGQFIYLVCIRLLEVKKVISQKTIFKILPEFRAAYEAALEYCPEYAQSVLERARELVSRYSPALVRKLVRENYIVDEVSV